MRSFAGRSDVTVTTSEMGGTGLEPVTPSLSIRSSVLVSSLLLAPSAWLSETRLATERSSERERTLILAILATPPPARGWYSAPAPQGRSSLGADAAGAKRARVIADLLQSASDRLNVGIG